MTALPRPDIGFAPTPADAGVALVKLAELTPADVCAATVVFVYLLPHLNLRLRSRLQTQLRPGSRLVSPMFAMGGWVPDTPPHLEPSEEDSVLYRWRIPH